MLADSKSAAARRASSSLAAGTIGKTAGMRLAVLPHSFRNRFRTRCRLDARSGRRYTGAPEACAGGAPLQSSGTLTHAPDSMTCGASRMRWPPGAVVRVNAQADARDTSQRAARKRQHWRRTVESERKPEIQHRPPSPSIQNPALLPRRQPPKLLFRLRFAGPGTRPRRRQPLGTARAASAGR